MGMTRYHCDCAYLGGDAVVADVAITVDGSSIIAVERDVPRAVGDVVLTGLTLPGFANAHSHAFHRVLRARAEGPGTFWNWRDEMYAVAAVLDPDIYYRLGRAAFAEMVLAGFSAVGEFHYLHRAADGHRYANPNEMGLAICEGARDAGTRITLLDTCYLESAPGMPAEGVQQRFSDGHVEDWADRVDMLVTQAASSEVRVGAAAHSLRAVPPEAVEGIARWAARRHAPFHIHVSEQPAENDAVATAYGASPTVVLAEHGAFGPSTTVVHATHLRPADASTLSGNATTVCMCPTTERALGDGIGVAAMLAEEGCPIALGTDSHAAIDPFEEARSLELNERLRTRERGRFTTAALLEHAVFAASSADVTDVVASGRRVVVGGRHQVIDDAARELTSAIGDVVRSAAGY